jgi:hypothetical protein
VPRRTDLRSADEIGVDAAPLLTTLHRTVCESRVVEDSTVVRLNAFRTGLFLVAAIALIGGVVLAQDILFGAPNDLGRGPKAADVNPEAADQAEGAAAHREGFEQAVQSGTAGVAQAIKAAPALGWAGEQLVSAAADDWEPAVATDPHTGPQGQSYAYLLTTRYASTKPCPGNCPTPYIALYTSSNAGATWDAGKPLCACKGKGQFDPIIEVVPNTGAVYGVYMNGYNIMFLKSTDHGAHWTTPVGVYGSVSWNDKPILATSDDGKDVYISFNGPTGGDPYMAQSHDFGVTWTQRKLTDSARYIFAFDADVDSAGTVYFAETSLLYGGGGNKGTYPTGAIEEHVYVSTDAGASFTDHLVGSVQPGIACVAAGCSPDFYLAHAAITAGAAGNVVLLYDGATAARGNQLIYAQHSTNSGSSWSSPVAISAPAEESVDPAIEAASATDVRAWYMQTNNGSVDAWNVWYRTTADGGANWSSLVKISDASSGAAYKTANGFAEVYGDYGELGITSTGKSIAAWGEGTSYDGPGGVWFNRQP